MRTSLILSTLLALTLVTGCDDSDPAPPDAGPVPTDAGQEEADAGSACAVPSGNWGTSLGKNFSPFTLPRCDGASYEFYGEEEGFCDASFTVVSMAAGWCQPCRIEAELMQEELVQAYADRDVRVVVAVVQDNDYAAPDAAFCQGWVDQYGLTNDVVLDATQETGIYFPGGALPANLIVDSKGVIVHREYGVSDELQTIRAKLDQLLAD